MSTPTRTQLTRDSLGADRMERWEAPPLSEERVQSNGRNASFSLLGATEKFQRLPVSAAGTGVGTYTLQIPLQLASMTTAAADLMTGYVPGHAGKIIGYSFVTTTIGTGTSASQVLNFEIGTTNLTGGVLTLLLASTDVLGEKTDATAITAANVFTATDAISLEVASGGTVFTAGAGVLLIQIQNTEISAAFDAAQGTLGTVVGTGTEVIARAVKGGANFKTQVTTPADGDNVYYAPTAGSGLIAPVTVASRITFSTQISWGTTALATEFGSFGLNENPTDVDPTGTAGDGAMFVFDPTAEFITGATTAQKLCWAIAHKVAGADTFTFTTIPVVAGVDYSLEIKINEDKLALFYIDDVLVATGPALTTDAPLSAFVGAELTATPAGQAEFRCRFIQVGRLVG